MDGDAVGALAELVAGSPRLAEMNLARTGIERAGLCRLADAVRHSPGVVSVTYTGPRVAALDDLLAERRAQRDRKPPPRPDIALIRSVYR